MRRFVCLLLIFLLMEKGVHAFSAEKYIMVDTFNVIKSKEDIPAFLSNAQNHGVTTIFLLGKKREGDRSGYVIYNSSYAPPFYEWDVLRDFSQRAKDAGIKVYVWLPLLYDNYLFRQEGYGISNNWVSPINNGVKKYLSNLVSELVEYEIEGILFDDLSYEDEYSASRELQNEFNKTFHYEDLTYSLPTEKERDSPIWRNWLAFKRSKLEGLYTLFTSSMKEKKIGIIVPPSAYTEDNQEGTNVSNYRGLSLIAIRNGEGVGRALNGFYLQTEAEIFVIVNNTDVRTVRDMSGNFRDVIFLSTLWNDKEFLRVEKAVDHFSDPKITMLSLLDYFSIVNQSFTKSGIDTLIIQAGHVSATLFFYGERKEAWSPYVQKYRKDYVEEYAEMARMNGLHVVFNVDASSPEYIVKHAGEAAFNYKDAQSKSRLGIVALTVDESNYKKELLAMIKYLSDNYEADAILLSGISYLEEDFGSEAFSSYASFMKSQGSEVNDWPRKTGGEIDIYDKMVGNWKSSQMEKLLSATSLIVHEANKEFWVLVDVSWTNPSLQSNEYGLYLPMVEKYADRIILDADFSSHNLSSSFFLDIAKNLPTVHSERYTVLLHLTDSPEELKKNLTDITNLKFYSFGIAPFSSFTQPYRDISYRIGFKKEVDFSPDIKQLWENGFYDEIPYVYRQLFLEKNLAEERERRQAKEDFTFAFKRYGEIEKSMEEAERYDIPTDSFKASFIEMKGRLEESQARFLEENFTESSRISLATLSFSEKLAGDIQGAIDKKLAERFTLSIALLFLFFIILLFTSQYLRRKK